MDAHTWILLFVVAAWIAYLAVERIRIDRHREAVPLRIAVSGTRGKTSVTRRLAAVLRDHGFCVLAKTTGSEAAYVFPDGSVHEIHRVGPPSIIEQKRLLQRGAALKADVVVAELMSVHAEPHRVEAQEILRPHMVLVTNFWVDHVEAQGSSPAAVASVLSGDVPPGAAVFVPEAEWEPGFGVAVEGRGASVTKVPTGLAPRQTEWTDFGPNLDLVWAAARHLGVEEGVIQRGIRAADGDLGALRVWRYRPEGHGGPWLLVNAFAANDPKATARIWDRVQASRNESTGEWVGLLSLRADRGDRTLQWVEALEDGALARFDRLFISGLHGAAVRHRLRRNSDHHRIRVLPRLPPVRVMEVVLAEADPQGGVLVGFGNISGLGETMVRHWRKVGEPHGL